MAGMLSRRLASTKSSSKDSPSLSGYGWQSGQDDGDARVSRCAQASSAARNGAHSLW